MACYSICTCVQIPNLPYKIISIVSKFPAKLCATTIKYIKFIWFLICITVCSYAITLCNHQKTKHAKWGMLYEFHECIVMMFHFDVTEACGSSHVIIPLLCLKTLENDKSLLPQVFLLIISISVCNLKISTWTSVD